MIHGHTEVHYFAFIIPDDFVKNGLQSAPLKLNCSKMQEETDY